jgi:hypothetical protein
MARSFLILLFVLLASFVCHSQINKSLASFIPREYDTLYGGLAKGDLNKDGIEDVVLALFHKMEDQSLEHVNVDSIPSRRLIVLFGTKNGYAKAIESSTALLCKHCGGVFGDPFNGIDIKKGVLQIYHYGGSAWKWASTHKFRLQNKQFYLIGQTKTSFWGVEHCDALGEMAGLDYEDINFITGQFERKKISTECKLVESKKGKQKTKPLVSLTKFTIEE